MTELTAITMNNLPAARIEQMILSYKGNLEDLGVQLFEASNKVKYSFVEVVERLVSEAKSRGENYKEIKEEYIASVFSHEKVSTYYAWENSHRIIKPLPADLQEKAFKYGEKFGVTKLKHLNKINNDLERLGKEPLTPEQIEDEMETSVENKMNVDTFKSYMDNKYNPTQESSGLGSSPVEFTSKIQFDDGKDTFTDVRFRDNDLTVISEWLSIDTLPDDRLARGDLIYRELQAFMLKLQSSGG